VTESGTLGTRSRSIASSRSSREIAGTPAARSSRVSATAASSPSHSSLRSVRDGLERHDQRPHRVGRCLRLALERAAASTLQRPDEQRRDARVRGSLRAPFRPDRQSDQQRGAPVARQPSVTTSTSRIEQRHETGDGARVVLAQRLGGGSRT
jgi:hypothetical protein